MYINKWLLYFITTVILFLLFVLPNIVFESKAKQVQGEIVDVISSRVTGRTSSYSRRNAVLNYTVGDVTYQCIAPSYVFETPDIGFKASIAYNPDKPSDGRVNNFYGIWGRTFVWLLPLYLTITLCAVAIDFIPTRIRIPSLTELDKKLFD
jgi:hypothetical protein